MSLEPVPPGRDLPEAKRWIRDADEALARARRAEQEHDPPPTVANSVKAIEFAAKALLYLGRFKHPQDHNVGDMLENVMERARGEQVLLPGVRADIARIAMLNKVSEHLHQIAEYGLLGISARDLLEGFDAETWLGHAERAVARVRQIVMIAEQGRVRFSP